MIAEGGVRTVSAFRQFFGVDFAGAPFVFFSVNHLVTLLILLSLCLLLVATRKSLARPALDKNLRITLSALLIGQEVALAVWKLSTGTWHVMDSLPLHLCGAAVVLSAIMLINQNHRLYELCFFWGLGGATQALLTPDVGVYGFPHFRFFQFFLSHGLIVLASIYMTFVTRYRPTHSSIWRVFALTNGYAVVVAGFNWLTDANYLFICHKPLNGSLLDYLGPWPWYILSLELGALVSLYVLYAPFACLSYLQRRRTQ